MARILQYIHRPNMTELGMGNTHDRYLVGPEDKLKLFFPLGVATEVVDVYSNKTYSLYSKIENDEFRIKLMGGICEDYQLEPGDEVVFTRYESKEGTKTSLQIIECGRVFLNPGKRENGIINDFEIVNIEKLPRFNKESILNSEYSFLGEKHQIEIKFSETRRKRTDSPELTDFYSVKYDGKLLESKNSPIYFLSIRNNSLILITLQKCEFNILLNEGYDEKKSNTQNCLQQIFYGAPGSGKSHDVKKQTGELLDNGEERDLPNVFRTTFHPDTDYASFVGCYKPTMRKTGKKHQVDGKDVDDEEIIYEFVPQTFTDAYVYAYKNPTEPTFLVIEEINRGNCAQIFGDLFQLLDRKNGVSEYKIKADKDLAKFLNKELGEDADGIKDGKLCLPANLNILATMNTSDQSLFPIDSAFKRRWDWKYIPIRKGHEKRNVIVKGKKYDWWTFVDRMNSVVYEATSSEDKKMGFYFCKANDKKIYANTFVSKVVFYLWNDVFKDNGLDWLYDGNPVFKYKDEDGKEEEMTFASFFKDDGSANEEQVLRLMKNLKIEEILEDEDSNNDVEDELDEDVQNGINKFALNGVKMTLRDISKNIVLNYAQNNPSLSAQEIRDYFINTFKGIGIAHVVETAEEYHRRDGQKSQERTVSEITIPSQEKLYVTTQWLAKDNDDNFFKFMEIVNREGLGTITKVS